MNMRGFPYLYTPTIRGRCITLAVDNSGRAFDFYYRRGKANHLWSLEVRNCDPNPYFPVRDSIPGVLEDFASYTDASLNPLELPFLLDDLRQLLATLMSWDPNGKAYPGEGLDLPYLRTRPPEAPPTA